MIGGKEIMLRIEIPGYEVLAIDHLVLDFNGTIAKDGSLIEGVAELIKEIAQSIDIYVITADTYGNVQFELRDLPINIIKIETNDEKNEKRMLIKKLGSKVTASIGNGNNDEWMLEESRLGICIIGQEGCSTKALHGADIAITDIRNALELFTFPNRLKATLRY
jgi:soluble P-type ATPase